MKTKIVLMVTLSIMAAMIIFALVLPVIFERMMDRSNFSGHIFFVHILTVSLFFANAVVGMFWEARSLVSGGNEVILYTYRTVSWLDAHFSSPLIILSVTTGIMLSFGMGGIWSTGWLSLAFLLFLLSGAVWVIGDIPTQYRVKSLMEKVDPSASSLPAELKRLLRTRLWISLAGVIPLLVVFILMVYKPVIVPVSRWFG